MNLTVDQLIALAGNEAALGLRLGVARPTVYGWKRSGRIPASRIFDISVAFGIPLHELANIATPPRNIATKAA